MLLVEVLLEETKTSDVDVFVIDDTDVKRMSRLELLEKLRGIIYHILRSLAWEEQN